MSDSLEQSLEGLEARLDAALKAAQGVLGALKRTKAAVKTGALRDIDKTLSAARVAGTESARKLDDAGAAWSFDAETYFADGRYQAELLAAARQAGLSIFETDGRLYCFPMLLSIAPRDLAVLVDRKPERRVRPSTLARLLAARQKQPQRFGVERFLETLYAGYRLLAPRFDRAWTEESSGQGPVVPLAEIHETLTLMPGAARDYPLPEFARDVFLLDRQPDVRTRDGRSFTLPAATGTRGGRRLTVVDEQGGERVYVGLRFARP